ncbi:MAG: ABC transporter ATP-binding protein, partial [Nitrososphaerales archaeon]
MVTLEVKNLRVSIDNKEIIRGLDFSSNQGEVHAIMGPNGSGKSTLAYTLLGHPKYTVTEGDILINGESLLEMSTDERARKGLFLGFQYPTEVSGVGYSNFLRSAYNSLSKAFGQENREVFLTVREFHDYIKKNLDNVGLDSSFLGRY